MTLEEQILRLENQREVCLDEIEDEMHIGMQHLRHRLSPARFVRRHLVSSMVTAAIAGVFVPWLAALKVGKAGPFGHTVSAVAEAKSDSHEQTVAPVGKNSGASPPGSARRLLSAVVRTAAVEVASRVDIPGLISRWTRKPEKPEENIG